MRSPLLFLVFNRPETTRRVFESIRAARPPRFYVAADGPRADRLGEARICDEVRSIVSAVNWPCEIKTLFRDHNLGCKNGVSNGIGWFFKHETEGIILEDDVLPISTFFEFCDEMLDRYRTDSRIAMISGSNLIARDFSTQNSYFFSQYCNIWGWATWRRVWQHYDVSMRIWPNWRDEHGLGRVSGGRRLFETYWTRIFDAVHAGEIDTWDYQWTFNCWHLGGLTVLPARNQNINLGFGADATHTTLDAPEYVAKSRSQPLSFPLVHPKVIKTDSRADALIGSKIFGISRIALFTQRLRDIPAVGNVVSWIKVLLKYAFQ